MQRTNTPNLVIIFFFFDASDGVFLRFWIQANYRTWPPPHGWGFPLFNGVGLTCVFDVRCTPVL